MKRLTLLLLVAVAAAPALVAQPVFRGSEIFPPDEFADRRAKVIAQSPRDR